MIDFVVFDIPYNVSVKMAAAATEKKFIALRKRLDQLGYRQPLGMESYLLVDRLFGDLVQTTDSLRKAKKYANPRGGGGDDANAAWTDAVGAYKAENARLVRENNDLDAKLLAERETLEERVRELRVTLRRENADLKFVNSRINTSIAFARTNANRRRKTVELQEKERKTPGGRKKLVAFRKQRMDVEAHVPPPAAAATAPRVVAPEPFLMDMMKMADLRNEQMSEKIVALEESEKASARAVQSLRKQVRIVLCVRLKSSIFFRWK